MSYVGQIKQVKVLGILGVLDEGDTDWKIIVVDVQDPLAYKLNDVEDIQRYLPGLIRATWEWFRCVLNVGKDQQNVVIAFSIYKLPDGKPVNEFAFNGEAKNKEYAMGIIRKSHDSWRSLVMGGTSNATPSCEISMSVLGLDC